MGTPASRKQADTTGGWSKPGLSMIVTVTITFLISTGVWVTGINISVLISRAYHMLYREMATVIQDNQQLSLCPQRWPQRRQNHNDFPHLIRDFVENTVFSVIRCKSVSLEMSQAMGCVMGRSWCQNVELTCWGWRGWRQGETELLAGHSRDIPKPCFSSLFLGVLIDASVIGQYTLLFNPNHLSIVSTPEAQLAQGALDT